MLGFKLRQGLDRLFHASREAVGYHARFFNCRIRQFFPSHAHTHTLLAIIVWPVMVKKRGFAIRAAKNQPVQRDGS